MQHWFTWLKYGLLILITLFGLVIAGGYYRLRSALPETTGQLRLPGLGQEVTIVRDIHGVPTITAAQESDAYFALGFVHAQDRLFQLDVQRRYAAGRMAEITSSEKALNGDRYIRRLGLYRSAQAALQNLPASARMALESYSAGINAFLQSRKGALPVEFSLFGYIPEPWHAEDSLAIMKLRAMRLSGNLTNQLLRSRLAGNFSEQEIQELLPTDAESPESMPKKLAIWWADPALRAMAEFAGPTAASNNWVVDGRHSVTGKPLLANDPHLDFSLPGIWYLARMRAPGMNVTGGTIPGAPFVLVGHTEKIAWGVTSTGAAVTDLFMEQVDPQDPGRYLSPQGSQPFITRVEEIKIKGGKSEQLTIRETRHGPVIADSLPGSSSGEKLVLALQATFLSRQDSSVQAGQALQHAIDWKTFKEALRYWDAPALNFVFADVDGNIGSYTPARIPLRKHGDGTAPVPGWSGEYDWIGWIPFDALPQTYNPAEGMVVTANNKIVASDYPDLITRDWGSPNRALRIKTLLEKTPKQSIQTSTDIMADTLSIDAQALLPRLLDAPVFSERSRQAIALLKKWDGNMAADRPEPLIFSAWRNEIVRRLLANRLRGVEPNERMFKAVFLLKALTQNSSWCQKAEDGAGDCNEIIAGSLEKSLQLLTKEQGAEQSAWRWGARHQVTFDHPLLKYSNFLKKFYRIRMPTAGGDDTVNAAVTNPWSDSPFYNRHGPALRAIYDLADLNKSVFIIAPGQTEQILSRHRSDLIPRWGKTEWISLATTTAKDELRLLPQH